MEKLTDATGVPPHRGAREKNISLTNALLAEISFPCKKSYLETYMRTTLSVWGLLPKCLK